MKAIDYYYKACEKVMTDFLTKYYKDAEPDYWWVGDDIGGVLYVNDSFYSMGDMLDFLKYDYTPDQMFAYNEYQINTAAANVDRVRKEPIICIRDWLKLYEKED